MALSSSVEESLEDAQGALRNALAYAARNERPIICERIAELLSDIDTIGATEGVFDTLDDFQANGTEGEEPCGNFDF